MNVDEFPSDSEVSDEDYHPDEKIYLPSEEESDGDIEHGEGNQKYRQGTKRVNINNDVPKKRQKILKTDENSDQENEHRDPSPVKKDAEKKRADSLWADFLKDTGTKPKTISASTILPNTAERSIEATSSLKPTPIIKEKITVTKIFEFAGEEVKVIKEVLVTSADARLLNPPSDSGAGLTATYSSCKSGSGSMPMRTRGGIGGIQSLLGQIVKKEKISTLEKSKLDWDGFKKTEGIEEEIQTHNKGKNGFLEKQDFLERADLRLFEIEKKLRSSKRSHR